MTGGRRDLPALPLVIRIDEDVVHRPTPALVCALSGDEDDTPLRGDDPITRGEEAPPSIGAEVDLLGDIRKGLPGLPAIRTLGEVHLRVLLGDRGVGPETCSTDHHHIYSLAVGGHSSVAIAVLLSTRSDSDRCTPRAPVVATTLDLDVNIGGEVSILLLASVDTRYQCAIRQADDPWDTIVLRSSFPWCPEEGTL